MLAIYKKELKSYFTSMIGYVFMAFFLVVIGIYFVILNMLNGYANFEYVLDSITFLFVILIPILTMRIITEEKKMKTDQLLFTSPVSVERIIIGKYMATATMFLFVIIPVLFYPLILKQFGEISLATAYSSLIGFFFLGSAYLAIGIFLSSLTESQAIAAVLTFVVILFTNLLPGIIQILPSDPKSNWLMLSVLLIAVCILIYLIIHNEIVSITIALVVGAIFTLVYFKKQVFYQGLIGKILGSFAVSDQYSDFVMGIFDFSSIIYYLSIIIVFIFLAIQNIKKSRWYG